MEVGTVGEDVGEGGTVAAVEPEGEADEGVAVGAGEEVRARGDALDALLAAEGAEEGGGHLALPCS